MLNNSYKYNIPRLKLEELSKYINESTNKSLERYKDNSNRTSLVISESPNTNPPKFGFLFFVSFISFLAGYHFRKITNK